MLLKRFTTSIYLVAAITTLTYAQQNPVGFFEHHQDVGAAARPGSVVYDADKLTYTINASGTNMWATKDEFYYAPQLLTFFIQNLKGTDASVPMPLKSNCL